MIGISSRDQWPEIIGGIKGLDGLDKEDITYESLDNPEVQQIYKAYQVQLLRAPVPPESDS